MYLLLTASKDTYITDKIIGSQYRVEDANVGQAGTLDLFKLYNESILSGTDTPIELSRLLIHFDTSYLKLLTSSILNLNDSSFKCYLKMKNVNVGQFTPANFNIRLYPLSQSWFEGSGRDVNSFSDVDVANFMTASLSGGTAVPWFISGANAVGILNSDDIDIVGCGSLGNGLENLYVSQYFEKGNEDLWIDVTKLVSSTLTSQLPDFGWRLSYGNSEENNEQTYFVKRFASRHAANKYLVPKLHVIFDDSIIDNHESFYFDETGSLYLKNYIHGQPTNIRSGSSLTQITGSNCLLFIMSTGSYYSLTSSVSSRSLSTNNIPLPGFYYTNFCIPYTDQSAVYSSSAGFESVYNFASKSGSIKFDTRWLSNDQKIIFHTGTLQIKSPYRTSFTNPTGNPVIMITNLKNSYHISDTVRMRIFAHDTSNKRTSTVKTSIDIKSFIYNKMYYQIRDSVSGDIIIPFETMNNGTRVSTDSSGMYFDLIMRSLISNHNYTIDFLIIDAGCEVIVKTSNLNFRVDP